MKKYLFILSISGIATSVSAQNLVMYVQQSINQNNRGNQNRNRGNITNILVTNNVKQQQQRVSVNNFYMNQNESTNMNDVNPSVEQSDNTNVYLNKTQMVNVVRTNIQTQNNPPVRRNTNVVNPPVRQVQNNVNVEANTNVVAQVQFVMNNDNVNTQQMTVANTENTIIYQINDIDLSENVGGGNEDVQLLNYGTDHQTEWNKPQIQVKNFELPKINEMQSINPISVTMPKLKLNIEKPVLDLSWMTIEKSQKKKKTSTKRITGNKNYSQDKPSVLKNVFKKKGKNNGKKINGKNKYECFRF